MATKKGLAHRLYIGELAYDFISRRKRWYALSALLLVISLAGLGLRGLNLGIEFKGGADFQVPVAVTESSVPQFREVIQDLALENTDDTQVMTVGGDKVRVQTRTLSVDEVGQVRSALAAEAGVDAERVNYSLIGASWGKQITQKGLIALVVFLVLVMILIWAYFREAKMAVSAIVALLHDLVITVGIYALSGFSVTPSTLIGILTILGYSLYDTVVVFDKVRENTAGITKGRRSYAAAANAAVNQVLIRSINTTIIGVLPVAALLFAGTFVLGTGPLKDLGLALFIGMIAGAYSSVFLATPLLVDLKEREPGIREHNERLDRREAKVAFNNEVTIDAVAEPRTEDLAALPVTTKPVGVVPAERAHALGASAAKRPQPVKQPRSQRRK